MTQNLQSMSKRPNLSSRIGSNHYATQQRDQPDPESMVVIDNMARPCGWSIYMKCGMRYRSVSTNKQSRLLAAHVLVRGKSNKLSYVQIRSKAHAHSTDLHAREDESSICVGFHMRNESRPLANLYESEVNWPSQTLHAFIRLWANPMSSNEPSPGQQDRSSITSINDIL